MGWCVDLGLGRVTCYACADLCCFLCVCFYWSLLARTNDDAAAPVRDQGNFENTRLNPVNVAVPFVVNVEVVSLMVICILLHQRKLAQRSERVKSVDLHPTEPW